MSKEEFRRQLLQQRFCGSLSPADTLVTAIIRFRLQFPGVYSDEDILKMPASKFSLVLNEAKEMNEKMAGVGGNHNPRGTWR